MEAKDIKAKGKAGGGGFLAAFEGETADPMVEVSLEPLEAFYQSQEQLNDIGDIGGGHGTVKGDRL